MNYREIELINYLFVFYSIVFFGVILLRYFLVAGGTYLFLYSPLTQSFLNKNRPYQSISWELIKEDIKLSVLSSGIFALSTGLIISGYSAGMTSLYLDAQQYGLWYLGVSYVAVLLLQDAYFYATHRLFHHPLLFSWVHKGHHRLRYPTPWTSFAFDPIEAVVHSLFLVGIIFFLPIHYVVLIAIASTMTVWAVLNHLGLDRLPLSFPHHWFGRWFIGPAHHSVHHLKYTVHYGLYFTFWDKFFKTQDPSYLAKETGNGER